MCVCVCVCESERCFQVLEASKSLFPKWNKKQISDSWSALPHAPCAVLQILVVPSMVWCSEPQPLPAHQYQNKKLGHSLLGSQEAIPTPTGGNQWLPIHTIPLTGDFLWQGKFLSERSDYTWEERKIGVGGPGVSPDEIHELKSLEAIKWRKDRAKVASHRRTKNPKSIRSIKAISTLLPRCACVITGWKSLPCEPLLYEFHWEFKARWNKQGNQGWLMGWSVTRWRQWSQTELGLYPVTVGFLTGSAWLF